MTLKADFLLITITEGESKAIFDVFQDSNRQVPQAVLIGDQTYYDIGVVNRKRVFLLKLGLGLLESEALLRKCILDLSPTAVILVGLAFGFNSKNQSIGDILVSTRLIIYETQRLITKDGSLIKTKDGSLLSVYHRDQIDASPRLLNCFQKIYNSWDESNYKVKFGSILSSEKILDNINYYQDLNTLNRDDIIGGEIGGAGLYEVCRESKVDWIVVKSISDFVGGDKSPNDNKWQVIATQNAAKFVLHMLQLMPASFALPGQLPAHFAVSGFNADIHTERDLIGIGSEVDAFAYLIAAKTLQPPMAIGLFGDWGSGKSFFMESLRQRIHTITLGAQRSNQPQKEISVYKYIAQIEFNAWHYVEGELWASLVDHIFRNLKTRSEDQPSLLHQRRQEIIEKLDIQGRAKEEAQARKDELKSQLDQAKERVTKLEKERDIALQKLTDLKAKDILKTIPLTDYEKEKQILENLGLKKDMKNAADLMQSADELRVVLERGNALTTRLREHGWDGWKWAAALVVVILIGPFISFVLNNISELPTVTNALVSVGAFLSGLTIMLKKGTMWLSESMTRVEDIRIKLDARRSAEAEKHDKKITEAECEYNEKKAEYDQAKNKEKEKERAIAELEQELQQVTPGRLLLDFINERMCSLDYRKHLGIAALIRSDFEQLSQLIEEQNKEFIERDKGKVSEEDKHLINRIVLYIDDLDRCPPDRVVQVLQAIHLLLAFPLFVVVVAVDVRWLSQSLQTHYQNLLSASTLQEDFELSKSFGRQASPQDYLEKIFQIPFWMPPLPEKARINIVKGLLSDSLVPSSEVDDKTELDNSQKGMKDTIDARVDGKERAKNWGVSENKRLLDLNTNTDLKPQGLDIEEIELQFMDELRSLLGQTPRSVKRFVNIYRLIKAISLNQGTKFVEDRPNADFKLVLFLLAVLIGLPTISSDFFKQLRSERSEIEQTMTSNQQVSISTGCTLGQVLAVLEAHQMPPRGKVLTEKDEEITLDKAGNGQASGWIYEERNVCHDLVRLKSWVDKYDGGSWLNLDATVLANWAPQVMRFSFQREDL